MTQPTEAESKMVDKVGNFQVANRQPAIADGSTSHTMLTSNEANDAFDAQGVILNSIIAALQAHGLIAE